ncbi:MAG: ABC transporter substrate-binding protein [Anaerolineales bacterium]|nr:ABC transporter substrate-binding protein [Anaerolineales bacterium]
MHNQRLIKTVVLLVLVTLIITACSPQQSTLKETVVVTKEVQTVVTQEVEVEKLVTPTADPSGIKRGGILNAAISADPQGFDPHITSAYSSFQVLENVYDTLVTVDENLNMVPSLATGWEISEDNLTWTFHLQEGIKFHNGRELTADDVVYSYQRIMNPDTGSGASWRFSAVESIDAPDALTVVIRVASPSPNLLNMIGGYKGMSIVPKEIVDDGTVNTTPIGTGPFKFVEYVPGDRVVLEANSDYWEEGKPYLDGVTFKIIPEETVLLTNLLTGEVDWAGTLPPQQVTELATSGEVIVDKVSGNDYWYIGLNLNRKPFDDVKVRQAIAYAINRAEVAMGAKWDTATANQGPIPNTSSWYSDYQPYTQDLEKARQLLAEAGYPDGFKTEFMVTNFYEETVRAAQVLQAQLAQIGINAEIRTLEWGAWLEDEGKGNYDMYIMGWIGNMDPDEFYYSVHHTGEVFNFTGYSNPTLDELLEKGRVETDVATRMDIYSEVSKIVIDDAPYVFLYNPANVNAWQPYVRGYFTRSDNAINFDSTWLDR